MQDYTKLILISFQLSALICMTNFLIVESTSVPLDNESQEEISRSTGVDMFYSQNNDKDGNKADNNNLLSMDNDQELMNNNDKRAQWNNLQGGWGKRAEWNKLSAAWGKRPAGWNNLSGMWGKRATKWNELSGMWGKRGWNDMSPAWGKREPPHWNKLRGMWGKRSIQQKAKE